LTELLKNPFKIAKMIKNRKSVLETSPITVPAPLKFRGYNSIPPTTYARAILDEEAKTFL